jgi:hypothetical protein
MLKYAFVKHPRYAAVHSPFAFCSLCFGEGRIHMREAKRFQPIYTHCEKGKGTELNDLESINPVLFSKCLLDENLIVTRSESCQRNWTLHYVPSETLPHTLRTDPSTCQGFSTYCGAVRAEKKLILYVERIIFHTKFSCIYQTANKYIWMEKHGLDCQGKA